MLVARKRTLRCASEGGTEARGETPPKQPGHSLDIHLHTYAFHTTLLPAPTYFYTYTDNTRDITQPATPSPRHVFWQAPTLSLAPILGVAKQPRLFARAIAYTGCACRGEETRVREPQGAAGLECRIGRADVCVGGEACDTVGWH